MSEPWGIVVVPTEAGTALLAAGPYGARPPRLERERLRISDALKRAGRDRWGRRLEALTALDQDLRRRWGANPNPEKP